MGASHPDAAPVLVVLLALLLLAFAIPVGLYLLVARVELAHDRVIWRKLLRHGSFSVEEVKGFAYDPTQPLFVIVDRGNRRLLRLHTGLWTQESLDALSRFVSADGHRVDGENGSLRPIPPMS